MHMIGLRSVISTGGRCNLAKVNWSDGLASFASMSVFDSIETLIEDGVPHPFLLVLAQKK